ncbi:MAG: bifunctional UDP-N-acetylmuramoyl-tripeptide:D-alanyl-D-alanine ligase/alanine racemase [Sphingobacteriales bacterium]|nr:MAG: bifunctional UDP-N-acetylmuramoyl-tripeptide:D-alanyl-D-alanine ligase/alanine racemase [Sphingobacteriales bacterium]
MPQYTVSSITEIVKGRLIKQSADAVIEHLQIDSRKITHPAESLFFAIITSHRNGHKYIDEVYKKGGRNFMVSEEPVTAKYAEANFIIVADTLKALQQLAAYHRKQFSIPVIGITGSNGKTMVKEWLNQLLEDRFNIVRSPKSYNSQIGVPLSVWQLYEAHELAIFEAGISQAGEMQQLADIIQPTIGIFTNIGEAHQEGFKNIDEKVKEKAILFQHAQQLVYCSDYTAINKTVSLFNAKKFDWSKNQKAWLTIKQIEKHNYETIIKAKYNDQPISITIPFTDDASIENAIHCWSVLLILPITQQEIQEKMKQLRPIGMRLEMKKGINNCTIINDSYSADLSSLQIALNFLSQQKQHSKRTVILTDFLQSGKTDKELYSSIAYELHRNNISRIIGIGEKIKELPDYFTLKEKEKTTTSFYSGVDDFLKGFDSNHFSGELILIKGARAFELERISRLLEQKTHQTVLEINLNAVAHNLKEFRKQLKSSTKIMAMVKAFSYGSGSYEIASLLQFHKVDYLAVAYADEGVELRKAGITLPIMVMTAEEETYPALAEYDLEPEIYSFNILQSFAAFLHKEGLQSYPVHIKLDTGMHRLGFMPEEIPELCELLKHKSYFKVQSVFSHLAASEDAALDDFTLQQYHLFSNSVKLIEDNLGYSFIKHIDNSAGILRHPQLQMDMVRLGIGLYGINSSNSPLLQLQEVSSLKTTIAQIKKIKANETVGYGRKGKVNKDSVIATVRIGYADGYSRKLGNGVGKMLVNGEAAPVIGNICMDMTMLNITGISNVNEGDDVIVFGQELSINEVAKAAQTIPYEIMTGISQRVKRIYFEE